MVACANDRILQRHSNAIATLLAKVLSANDPSATASATVRINRMIRSRAGEWLAATAAKA